MQQRDSFYYTLTVAAVLCVVCSLAVSAAAVRLRPKQEANELLDQQRSILDATGLAIGEYGFPASELSREQIAQLSDWISEAFVDLETGEYTKPDNSDSYKLVEVAADPKQSVLIENTEYDPGEPRRPKIMKVYLVKQPGSDNVQQVVLPVFGKGLWGTLYGYLAVKNDWKTVQGITFYQHKETPGLGGEVDNPLWKSLWKGRKLFDADGEPAIEIVKGRAPSDNPSAVDGLSGATITSRGVETLLRYWTSQDGYGPFLDKLAEASGVEPAGA